MRVELEKLILDQDPDPDQSQNLKECSLSEGLYPSQKFHEQWSLAEGLSFHVIWFKSVSNFLRYPNRQTDRQTDRQTPGITVPPQLRSLAEVIK